MGVSIYHNPRCSKSRQTLALLQERGVEMTVVEYLKTPPSAATLKQILKQLNLSARQLIRKNEKAYREADLDNEALSETELIAAISKHPILMQRPIVVNHASGKAVIGRPPEKILDII